MTLSDLQQQGVARPVLRFADKPIPCFRCPYIINKQVYRIEDGHPVHNHHEVKEKEEGIKLC